MCIIICKPYGKKVPLNHLEEAFKRNPDGAGIAYTTGNGITIKKGFFDYNHFLKKCQKYNREDVATVFHFRIATHGGVNLKLCHPFPITAENTDIEKKKLTHLKYAVAHNGVLRLNGLKIEEDDSDTTAFIKTHLHPIYTVREEKIAKNEEVANYDNIIESLINGSKLAIIGDNGYIKRYGRGWQEDNGIYYSNSSYQKITYQNNWSRWQNKNANRWNEWGDNDTGYFGGSYWINGRIATDNEYKAYNEQRKQEFAEAEAEWYESLRGSK